MKKIFSFSWEARRFRFNASMVETREAFKTRLKSQGQWNEFLELTQTTEGHIFLAIVIAMCVFHTVNGIRVMLGHGGIGVGKPARPDYPYDPASQNYRHKIGIYSAIVLAAIAMMYGLAVMFGE